MFKGYSPSFWLMSIAILFFLISFNLILPEMNDFISKLGGDDVKGFTIALFTVSAGLSRPFSGKLADYIGRKKVTIIGFSIALIASFLYPICSNLYFFLFIRFLHGFSAGFAPTGATALITDLVPADKRGVAMGIFGVFISLGFGFGQGLSTLITDSLGINGLFLVSSSLVIISGLITQFVIETLENPIPFKRELLIIKNSDILERNVLPVAIVMILSAFCSGIIFVMSSDVSVLFNIKNKGSFFIYYALITIITRIALGRISDKIGRPQTILIGMGLLCFSMILLAFSKNNTDFTFASVIFGLATGVSSPTIFAWTADLSPSDRRGVGAGTMFIALELGIFLGSLSVNYTFNGKISGIFNGYILGALTSALAGIYLIYYLIKRKGAKF